MKIDYYPINESVAEKIRKKADITFLLLCSNYRDTLDEYAQIVSVLNSEIPEGFSARFGETNILFINNKILVLGGLGAKSKVTKDKVKEILNKLTQLYELRYILLDNPVVMIYAPGLKNSHLESMRESLYELNGIHKMNSMIKQDNTNKDNTTKKRTKVKDLFKHVFIAK